MNDDLRRSSAHVFTSDLHACSLGEDDLHHLGNVLRLRVGEVVTVSDGDGSWRRCEWVGEGVRTTGEIRREIAAMPTLTVAIAPLKGDRTELVIEKLVELGIDAIVILEPTDHAAVRWQTSKVGHVMGRYARVGRAAAMQSRRVFLPSISGPVPLSSIDAPGTALAEPGGTSSLGSVTTLVIGPEGGFSSGETAASTALVDLGPHVLRAETAAIAGAALMVAHRARLMSHTE